MSDLTRIEHWQLPDLEGPDGLSRCRSDTQPDEEEADAEYERGIRDGRLAADREAVCELRIAATALVAAAEHIRAQRDEWVKELEEHVVVLALGVAREIIQREMQADADVIRRRIAESFTEISWQSPTKVRLHPDDLTSVQAFFDADVRSRRPHVLRWVADDALERGDFIVVTPDRLVDGKLETVLEAIHQHLTDD